jgi:hypothetical protein
MKKGATMEKKRILVIDIPANATADESEELLNSPYAEDYYLGELLTGWPGVGARAFFKLRSRPEADGKDAETIKLIRDNLSLTVRDLMARLAQAGIKRSREWVGDKRAELIAAGKSA